MIAARAHGAPSSGRAFVGGRLALLGSALAVFGAARAYAPYVHDGPIFCVLRAFTGLPCPGCGLTRAFCALSHGDVAAALAFNACSIPLAFGLLAASAIASVELARGTAWEFYRGLASWKVVRAALIVVGVYSLGRCAYAVQ